MPRQTGGLCRGHPFTALLASVAFITLCAFSGLVDNTQEPQQRDMVSLKITRNPSPQVLIACQQGASRQYLQASDRPFRLPSPSPGILLALLLHTRNGCSEGLGHSMRHLAGPFQAQARSCFAYLRDLLLIEVDRIQSSLCAGWLIVMTVFVASWIVRDTVRRLSAPRVSVDHVLKLLIMATSTGTRAVFAQEACTQKGSLPCSFGGCRFSKDADGRLQRQGTCAQSHGTLYLERRGIKYLSSAVFDDVGAR